MEKYYTERPLISMREYGRYMQELVQHAEQIKDRELRQAYVEKIVELIMEMYPQTKGIDDYRLKIWSHILQMSDYKLDVDVPEHVPLQKITQKPERVAYPRGSVRYHYYGNNIHALIKKAIEIESDEKRADFIQVIAAYMKMSYKTWNQGEISDEMIAEELEQLSNGRLVVSAESDLDYLEQTSKKRGRVSNNNKPIGRMDAPSNNRRNNNMYGNNNGGKTTAPRRNNPPNNNRYGNNTNPPRKRR